MKIGVFYGSTNGNTADAAEKIKKHFNAEIHDVGKLNSSDELAQYDVIVLGTSTWYDGELQDDWESFIAHLKAADFSGKTVALFGLGDQEGYGSDYVSGMRQIYDVVIEKGAKVIGAWEDKGYSYEHSASVIDGKFVGLALDEDNQSELSDGRIASWCAQLDTELKASA
ncbi:flavodoxin [Sulfurospirillum barnesii]|uniref:Flavodoxin n=1 Tax=Sulfurospirillum barnesii (strain ATCC 700032 / DSM 10660 / SES-3) TaxID=760154 RepID=I3XZP8_SULBS|nr:flavodoxin [Sulfurospirillum barnesii]AFL69422.1 flavodoxin, long chain [Sulfurospirillum barnesii SES-3]